MNDFLVRCPCCGSFFSFPSGKVAEDRRREALDEQLRLIREAHPEVHNETEDDWA